jgi:SAM-dependent methyltransferase
MAPVPVTGTDGYAEEAPALFRRYEAIDPAAAHRAALHLMPEVPSDVLDIGSGTGRDAAWFAGMGHRVVAVEPTEAMRLGAIALHAPARITWLDDSLPDLAALRGRKEQFDLVMLTAVWMHIDAEQRRIAMPNLASLVRSCGVMIMKIRHGPIPPGRRMFEVPLEETIELAGLQGLHPVLNRRDDSIQEQNRAAGVAWTTLAVMKAKGSTKA